MRLIKHIKKNNGSTLTLVLFMLFMLSVTAIAVITLTGSELSMSVLSSDRSKALLVAEAGAEKAAQVIDEAVAQAQEEARVLSSDEIQKVIANFQNYTTDQITGKVTTETITVPFINVIDNNSTPGEIKILDEETLNGIYESEYKYQFYKIINAWYDDQTIQSNGNPDPQWLNSKPYNMNATNLNDGDSTDGVFKYTGVTPKYGTSVVSQLSFETVDAPITSILLTSTGEYKSPSNGSTYKRLIEAEFSLLTEKNGNDAEIPISYGKLTKVRVNKDAKPSILSGKALIAQKNIISLDGLVNVTGDTVCFGTIPTKVIGSNVPDYDADGYKFGGIMAGMTPDVWNNVGLSIKDRLSANGNAIANALGLNTSTFFTTNHSGSFNFIGNVGTLAYLHSLYSTDTKKSTITVDALTGNTIYGNTFARSVKAESESNYSETQLKNVYTYDDLRIDGNNSKVKIGDWNADGTPVNAGNSADYEGLLVGLNTGTLSESSSAVIVAGDSELYINGSVYVGGSTFYSDYTNATNANETYISGMSIQKSDNRPAEAFEIDDNITIPTKMGFPGNVFYWYNNNTVGSDPYTYVNDPTEQQKIASAAYNKALDGTTQSVNMMTGKRTNVNLPEEPFDILDRAMHLKYIWNHFWKGDVGYSSYFNTGDIKITTYDVANDGTDEQKIKGFCYGGVAANDTIYGPYNGFTETTANAYTDKANGSKADYAKLMDLFINNKDELNSAIPTKYLSGNATASNDSVNKAALSANQLYPTSSNTFMYYGSGNVVLTDSSVGSNTELPKVNGYIRGIVYSAGDIYVKAGTNFKGILIAEGNIVFLGDADIEYDEDVVDNLIIDKPEVGRFFKHTASDLIMNDPNAIVQTIKKANVKNIKILSWKEI